MTKFYQEGDTWKPFRDTAVELESVLPAGNYVVRYHPQAGFYLQAVDPFKIPKRLYGRIRNQTARIISTFNRRPATTGVLLVGEKGSGKTLLAKNLCHELAANQNVPTLIVNTPYVGDEFNSFLQSISQPTVILFDEFEKVYYSIESKNEKKQEGLLTLLDGTFPSKKLFLLTCNERYKIDDHLLNRPGRLYYYLDFVSLEPEFVREYLLENLADMSHLEKTISIVQLFPKFNFDMLQALVEEMNSHSEDPVAALSMLNVRPEHTQDATYAISMLIDGKEVVYKDLYHKELRTNPLNLKGFNTMYKAYEPPSEDDEDKDDSDWDWESISFGPQDFVSHDPSNGIFVFEKGNVKVTLTQQKTTTTLDYNRLTSPTIVAGKPL